VQPQFVWLLKNIQVHANVEGLTSAKERTEHGEHSIVRLGCTRVRCVRAWVVAVKVQKHCNVFCSRTWQARYNCGGGGENAGTSNTNMVEKKASQSAKGVARGAYGPRARA
jgi:hypothetical protein